MPFDSINDVNGGFDPVVYFRRSGSQQTLRATLALQLSTNSNELNEFGWFETNSSGGVVGNKHILFQGSGVPPGALTADPVGTTVTFRANAVFRVLL